MDIDQQYEPKSTHLYRLRDILSRVYIQFILIFLIHLVVAVYYKEVVGLNITANPGGRGWDWFWQTIPEEYLRTQTLLSIWYLHAQPPLFNLFGAFFIKYFSPNFLEYMQYANILLGSLISGMVYVILFQFTKSKPFSFLAAIFLALNPSLFLYEAYILYDILTAFLVIMGVFLLALHSFKPRPIYLYLFILSINLLVLTRSLYHIIFLLVGILIAVILSGQRWKKVLLVAVLLCIPSFVWYAKNYYIFGFFGASSWDGLSLWKVASFGYTKEQLEQLVQKNVLDPVVVEVDVFSEPSKYRDYGFTKTSDIQELSQDDYNNINVIDISKVYKANSLHLIRYDPGKYLHTIFDAYERFSRPSSQFKHHVINVARMYYHERLYSQIFEGQILSRWVDFPFGSLSFFIVPISLLLFIMLPLLKFGFSPGKWIDYIKLDMPAVYTAILIIFTTLVGSMLEYGENVRYKFIIEQLIWVFALSIVYRYILYFKYRIPQFMRSRNINKLSEDTI